MRGDSQPGSSSLWLRVAIACGVLPLVVGVVSLIVFLGLEMSWDAIGGWVHAGVWILMGGLALLLLGFVTLGVYLVTGRRRGVPGRDLAQNALMTLLLLVVNFPVALACVWIAADSVTVYSLTFKNDSSEPVEDLLVTWPGGSDQVTGALHSRESVQFNIRVTGEGPIEYTSVQGGEACGGVVSGYVTTNLGGAAEVTFTGDCEFTVIER